MMPLAMSAFTRKRSSRVIPGFRGIPAGTKTRLPGTLRAGVGFRVWELGLMDWGSRFWGLGG